MTDNLSYTPEEVAKILKISKYTVYEMIKRGELGAYHIGRKVRIEKSDIENYKQKFKKPASGSDNISAIPQELTFSSTANAQSALTRPNVIPITDELIVCGQDMILDILTRHLFRQFQGIRFLRNYIGSMDGLIALYRGQANAVTVHLWDSDTDTYNLPYVRRLIPGRQAIVINLVYRMEGFYVPTGNPKNIFTWQDLTRPEVRFVNRERGSGARVLLDEKLRIENIPYQNINGYHDEEMSHLSVASKVARGGADVGLGVEKSALQVSGLDFIPLQKERYDLVIRDEDHHKPHIQALLQIIRSEEYRQEIEGLGGYDVSQMGEIMS